MGIGVRAQGPGFKGLGFRFRASMVTSIVTVIGVYDIRGTLWGACSKGILLFGGSVLGSLIFVSCHIV